MDAKRVVVQCMRKWGVTHCIQVTWLAARPSLEILMYFLVILI